MANQWRISALADRHRALGSNLEDWNGMGTAWTYENCEYSLADMHEAIRTKAGLMDVSGLRKVHYVGPHAEPLLENATTRDITKLYPGKSVYATMLNEHGKLVDDCVIYRTGPNAFMVVHGAAAGQEMLTREAQGKQVSVLFDDDLHDLSLQGPTAVDFLEQHVPGIRDLPYFHHMQTRLFGCPVMISRTGYTGERGYEIFCKALDTHTIWDTILEEGKSYGIIPCAFVTLDWLRVESYLLFYPFDMSEAYPIGDDPHGDSLWELGLDFTVSKTKNPMDFRGGLEHMRLKGKERFKIFGVLVEGDQPAGEGDELWADDKKVGVITCAMYSRLKKQSMALARLDVPYAEHGTPLEVRGGLNAKASAHTLPFDDPKKEKRAAKG